MNIPSGSKLGVDATKNGMANLESACSRFIGVRGWPQLIKMKSAEKLIASPTAKLIASVKA